jgi:molybdenum cofactor cytidylyltransferase
MHLIGVLLAAGRSRRMGRLKQLLPWPPEFGERPLVAAAFDAIAPACCAMVVVVGYEADAVVAALGERLFQSVRVDPDAEMLASVKAGLATARAIHPTADVLLYPADHPNVEPETIEQLIRASAEFTGRAVMPEFAGKGGHPAIIPAGLVPNILDFSESGGLRQFWLDHANRCVRVPVEDAGVVLDMDTPADYVPRADNIPPTGCGDGR